MQVLLYVRHKNVYFSAAIIQENTTYAGDVNNIHDKKLLEIGFVRLCSMRSISDILWKR